MRVSDIELEMKFELPIDRPDKNGCIYTKEAIKKAYKCDNVIGLPIIQYDENHATVPIGFVSDVDIDKSIVTIKGKCYHGGSECGDVKLHKNENGIIVIDEFKLTGLGLTK